jgi:hypothetical protein
VRRIVAEVSIPGKRLLCLPPKVVLLQIWQEPGVPVQKGVKVFAISSADAWRQVPVVMVIMVQGNADLPQMA